MSAHPKSPVERLDRALVRRGLAGSLHDAEALVLSGRVQIDGRRVDKAGSLVGPDADIKVIEKGVPFVSRGGLKLDAALKGFGLDVSGLVCADIGASTGGFTDCLLKAGAKKVYAIDVGYGLLDAGLRNDPRVTVLEKVNARFISPELTGGLVDVVTVDVSFISLRLVLVQAAGLLKPDGILVALVKPQFEAAREEVGRGGIVRDEAARKRAVAEVKSFAGQAGLSVLGEMESPVKGAKGNMEYLLYMRKIAGVQRG